MKRWATCWLLGTAIGLAGIRPGPSWSGQQPAPGPGRPGPTGKDIDPATVAAYENLGAVYGGWVKTVNYFQPGGYFRPGVENAGNGLPGFRFQKMPRVKPPDIAVPFGLELGHYTTDARLKQLADLKHLAALSLRDTQVTDAGLKELAGLDNLAALNLWGTPVTDAGLKELANLKNLAALELYGTRVTDAGLPELVGFNNLAELSLWNTQVTDAGLKELAGFQKLYWLNLRETQVTDAGLPNLAGLNHLIALNLSHTRVTGAGLKHLAGLKKLTLLELSLKDGHMHTLREIRLLHTITQATGKDGSRPRSPDDVVAVNLHDTQVTDAGLQELAPFQNLAALDLWGTQVTDAGLKHLAVLKKLASLNLRDTQVKGPGLKHLAEFKSLTLTVSVTDASLRSLREFGLLHTMSQAMGKCGSRPRATDDILTLDLSSTRLTDAGLGELAGLKNLTVLTLRGTPLIPGAGTRVTDAGLKHLAGLKNLAILDLSDTQVTDAGLPELAGLTNLTTLKLHGTRVTPTGLAKLRKKLPRCEMDH